MSTTVPSSYKIPAIHYVSGNYFTSFFATYPFGHNEHANISSQYWHIVDDFYWIFWGVYYTVGLVIDTFELIFLSFSII